MGKGLRISYFTRFIAIIALDYFIVPLEAIHDSERSHVPIHRTNFPRNSSTAVTRPESAVDLVIDYDFDYIHNFNSSELVPHLGNLTHTSVSKSPIFFAGLSSLLTGGCCCCNDYGACNYSGVTPLNLATLPIIQHQRSSLPEVAASRSGGSSLVFKEPSTRPIGRSELHHSVAAQYGIRRPLRRPLAAPYGSAAFPQRQNLFLSMMRLGALRNPLLFNRFANPLNLGGVGVGGGPSPLVRPGLLGGVRPIGWNAAVALPRPQAARIRRRPVRPVGYPSMNAGNRRRGRPGQLTRPQPPAGLGPIPDSHVYDYGDSSSYTDRDDRYQDGAGESNYDEADASASASENDYTAEDYPTTQ